MSADFQLQAGYGARLEQSDVNVAPGEFWLRGTELVLIEEVKKNTLTWTSDRGELWSGTLSDFRERALTRLGEVKGRQGQYLDDAWGIASARQIARDIRVIALSRVLRRAPDDETRLTVLRWSRSLSLGVEPNRRAT